MSVASQAHGDAQHAAHHGDGHHGDAQGHGTFKGYVTGFVLSVILTAIPFWLVMAKVLPTPAITTLVILAFLVTNAAVFGVVSGNAQRYQSRIMWLLPFLALCMIYDRRASRRSDPLARRTAAPSPADTDAKTLVQS